MLLVLMMMSAVLPVTAQVQEEEYRWTVYSALNAAQSAMFHDDGVFWVGTTGGAVGYSSPPDSFRILRTTEGLLSLNVSAIAVDPGSGDLYMGSNGGQISVLRANGRWSYATEIANMTDRPSRRITGFGFHDGLVYVLTTFGVGVYDPADSVFRESYFRFATLPQNTPVQGVAFLRDRIWLGTDKGLVHAPLDGTNLAVPSSWTLYTMDSPNADFIISMGQLNDSLIVGTMNGAYMVHENGYNRRSDIAAEKTMVSTNGSQVVAATPFMLYRYQDGRFNAVAAPTNEIMTVAIATDGRIGAGFRSRGFALLENDSFAIKSPNAPAGNIFESLALATDGALWAGNSSFGGEGAEGASRLKDGVWRQFRENEPPELRSNSVWKVGAGVDGSVWLGTYGGALTHVTPADTGFDAVHYDPDNSPQMSGANDSFIIAGGSATDANGRTWITTFDPRSALGPILMVRLRPGEESPDGTGFRAFEDDFNKGRVYCSIEIDDNGTKWLATHEKVNSGPGLYAFNDRGTINDLSDDIWKTVMSGEGGLLSSKPLAVAVDRLGEVWVGLDRGLSVLINPSSFMFDDRSPVFRTIRALTDIPVRAIEVDALNRKWVGTNQGIFLLTAEGDSVIAKFSEENSPLVNNDVRSLLAEDATGDIYIGTANGLNRISTTAVRSPETPENITVWPHPYILPAAEPLRIVGLPADAIIKIYGLGRTLVREFRSPGGSVALWDGRDNDGNVVASGVYIISAGTESGDNIVVGKVAVIRQ